MFEFPDSKKPKGIIIGRERDSQNSPLLYITIHGKLRKLHSYESAHQKDSYCYFSLPKKLGFFCNTPCILLSCSKLEAKVVLFAKDKPVVITIRRSSFELAPKRFYIRYKYIYHDHQNYL